MKWGKLLDALTGKRGVAYLLLICSLVLAFALSISLGAVKIPLPRLWQILSGRESSGYLALIIWQVRLPRTLAAMAVGMALAASGATLQGVLQNPLAAPSTIGVNAGAAFAAMVVFAYFPNRILLVVPAAFAGALVALLLIFFIQSSSGGGQVSLILGGVAISALLGAGSDTIRLLRPEAMVGASNFMIGGLSGITWSSLNFALPYLAGGILLALLAAPLLNVISLGDDVARSLGVPLRSARWLLLALAAILAGSSVAIAGLLGFVGLIVPHAARLLFGYDHRFLLPGVVILGGTLVLLGDLAARLIFAPYELPVGILLAFGGGPFFIYLLIRQQRGVE
ncbi:MAG: iron ABC transporter permease [Symbiobacteriaceae bacterium]|nr:iron ABC transporter permease [Symbiobacteriaceae bacterium]